MRDLSKVTLSQAETKKMGKLELRPGMPAEVHFKTADRTVLSYLVKPLTDQIGRASGER